MDIKLDYNKALNEMAMNLNMITASIDESSICHNKDVAELLNADTLLNLYGACLGYIEIIKKQILK